MTMMVDFTQPINDFNGVPILSGTTVTKYSDVACSALTSGYQDEAVPYEAKYLRMALAVRIKSATTFIPISFLEAMLITELVSRLTPTPLTTWRFGSLFDNQPEAIPSGGSNSGTTTSEAAPPASP